MGSAVIEDDRMKNRRIHLAQEMARVVYEALKMHHQYIMGIVLPSWDHAPIAQRAEMTGNALWAIENPDGSAEQAHAAWIMRMSRQGWRLGKEHSWQDRTHPSMRPFRELKNDEQFLDNVAAAIHKAMNQNEEMRIVHSQCLYCGERTLNGSDFCKDHQDPKWNTKTS